MARNFFQTLYLKSVFALVWALLVPQLGHASTATNPLKMFKRYFGTIDIGRIVISAHLDVVGSGQIFMEGVDFHMSDKPMSLVGL